MNMLSVLIRTAAAAVFIVGSAASAAEQSPKLPKLPEVPPLPEQPDLREMTPPPATGPARPDEVYGSVTGSRYYRHCLELVNRNPDHAYDEAMLWRGQGGGAAAEHCAAMALAALGQLEEAARRLTRVAGEQAHVEAPLRAEIHSQAGVLWLLAGKAEPAHEAFSQALLVAPPEDSARAQYLFDRAQSAANLGRWHDAVNDLTQSMALGYGRVDAFVLRARAHRALGDYVAARNDVEAALNLEPDSSEALFERAQVRHDRGDAKGARADLLRVRAISKSPELKEAARHKLAELDAKSLKIECRSRSEGDSGAIHLKIDDCPD